MKTSTIAPLSLVILLSTGLVAAQSPAPSRPASGTSSTPRGSYPSTTAPERVSPPPSTSPSVPAPSAPRSAPAAVAADYRLVAGDKLRVEVYKDEALSQSLQVRPDGKITLPLVGDVKAEGRTAAELRDTLVESLKEYNHNPVVTVIVVETVPPSFYVMGEVNSPGTLPLKGQISVVQALAMAGGFKDFAKKKAILIQRKDGVTQVPFNYNDAIKGKGSVVYVQPGDTIIVP